MMPLKCLPVEKCVLFLTGGLLAYFILFPPPALSEKEHLVHFPNTVYELNIYKIHGKIPGKTLMLIGGIQGNEPGGFLSADLYADMRLEKGNLIVVPRANFYSIILNHRGAHGDMNRKFTPEDNTLSMEDKIVTILKGLISESDYLLNLHDGSGYYNPVYIDKWRNPNRFGQSIIADCEVYHIPGSSRVLKLGDLARQVIEDVNPYIQNELYKFHFMNTKTDHRDSRHKEQQKSATYYALTKHHIPAFGVETSKFLPSIDLKVRYHNMIINSFMAKFGIIPQSPGLALEQPELKYIVVSINGEISIVVKKGQVLELRKGDSINISHIEANYERGLSLDIVGYGDLNDFRKGYPIFKNTSIVVRKDNHKFEEIPVKISKDRTVLEIEKKTVTEVGYFAVQAKGHRLLLANGETLDLVRGEKMKIIDVFPLGLSGITVNFKGFVGDKRNNTGEDRGYVIDTGNNLMKRYSLNKKGVSYPVIVSKDEEILGRMIVKLSSPELEYMVLEINGKDLTLLRPNDSISLTMGDRLGIKEVRTNLRGSSTVHMSMNGHRIRRGDVKRLGTICKTGKNELHIKKGKTRLGRVFIEVGGVN